MGITGSSIASRFGRGAVFLCLWVSLMACLSAHGMQEVLEFDIDAKAMPQALTEFAEQGDVQIFFLTDAVKGLRSDPVKGEYSKADALRILLGASGLDFYLSANGVVSVFPRPREEVVAEKEPEEARRPSGERRKGSVLEEIIVTAERREERLQDVPISVSALSGERLRDAGAVVTEDLMMMTPGLTMGQVGSPQVALRGVSTSNLNLSGDPGVGFYIDGVYIARASGQYQEFWDLERIEVLRGPQGTLYGRNTPGGVVHIINKEAGPETDLFVGVTTGNYGRLRAEGTLGGTLVEDQLFGRIALIRERRDGFATNIFDDRDVDDKDTGGIRTSLKWVPTDRFTADLRLEYLNSDDTGPPFKAFSPGLANFMGGTSPFEDDRAINASESFGRELTDFGATLRLDWNIDEQMTLSSITGYREHEFFQIGDLDDTELTTAWFESDSSSYTLQQEFQLSSTSLDERLKWITGVFLWRESANAVLAFPFPVFGITPINHPEIETYSVAGYGQASYYLSDRFRVTVGLRYTYDDKDFFNVVDLLPFFSGQEVDESRIDRAVTPRVSLDFFPQENVMLYVSGTRGFKSGGFNAAGISPSYSPEYLWAYEAGIKATLFDGRMQANLSGFYYDYNDVQVMQIVQAGSFLVNATDATIRGGELELRINPVSTLLFDLGVSSLHSKFNEFETFDPILDLEFEDGAGLQDLSGNRLPRAPKLSGNLGVEYTFDLGGYGDLKIRGDYQHQDRMYFDHFNRLRNSEGPVNLVNARVVYRSADDRWGVAAFGRNLTDEIYSVARFEIPESLGTVLGIVGPPRTWGVEVTYRY